ncbi:MAG TPA: hypothetical protein VD839_00995 [Burkholderiales bacterium]|jgi:hypothetical protein|nr:hypothetical protein [Burkholderiales bacterium]
MPTYRVVLNGVLAGLDPCQVAPRLAVMCKIPVEGAMALLASPSMVIKGALDQQTAATYQAALRTVGCIARIEEEADAGRPAPSPAFSSVRKHGRAALNALDLRQHAEELGRRAKSALLAVIGSAQHSAAHAGGWQEALSALSTRFAAGARTLAAPSGAKRTLRAHPLIVASVFVTTVAVAVFFASSSSSTEVPCPQGTQATDSMNCVGQVDFLNGEKYVGEVREGQPNGQGTYTWANGAKYVGQWTNGQRNGRGMYLWPNGEKYIGEFKNNKKHGQGTLIYANGRKYVGEFKDGNPVGEAARQQSQAAEQRGETRKAEVQSGVAQ